jgi:hypothetical protein
MYQAKKTGTTVNGTKYIILQDSPTSFHVSVSKGNFVICDNFHNPPNLEFLDNNILLLEQELYNRFPTGSTLDVYA